MSNWPHYESHKIVQAAKIVSIVDNADGRRTIMVRPENSYEAEPFEPTVPEMGVKAELGGWGVLYPDGFKSISPEKAFESGYTKVG